MKRLSCWQLVPFLQPSSTMQITRDAFIDSLEASRVELSWCNPFCIFRRAVGTVGADDKLVVNGRLMDGCSTAKTSSSCHGVVRRSFLYINFNVLLLLLLLLLLAVYGLPPFWNSASINTRAEPRRRRRRRRECRYHFDTPFVGCWWGRADGVVVGQFNCYNDVDDDDDDEERRSGVERGNLNVASLCHAIHPQCLIEEDGRRWLQQYKAPSSWIDLCSCVCMFSSCSIHQKRRGGGGVCAFIGPSGRALLPNFFCAWITHTDNCNDGCTPFWIMRARTGERTTMPCHDE